MRSILKNHEADMNAILTGIVIAITLAISVIIVWNVLASVDTTDIDSNFGDAAETPSANATGDLQTNLETFYTVMPIVLIVIAAVAILSYVMMLRRK